jgi:hypothetical protein
MSIERVEPGSGQESVWNYPLPPRLEPRAKRIRVTCSGGGERVTPSPRGFSGGWITCDVAGQCMGEVGTAGW